VQIALDSESPALEVYAFVAAGKVPFATCVQVVPLNESPARQL
jgi:hypothetical protein